MLTITGISKSICILGILCFTVPSAFSYSLPPPKEGANPDSFSNIANIFSGEAFQRHLSQTPGRILGNIGNSSDSAERLRSILMKTVKFIQEEQSQHSPLIANKIKSNDINQQEDTTGMPQNITATVPQDCFIEITKIERLPGRCQKLHGTPVCQSDKYINVDMVACS